MTAELPPTKRIRQAPRRSGTEVAERVRDEPRGLDRCCGYATRRYAAAMGEKTAVDMARELLLTTTREREADATAMQALLARNTSLRTTTS